MKTSHRSRVAISVVALCAGMWGLAAPATATTDAEESSVSPELEQLIADAQAEGKFVIYSVIDRGMQAAVEGFGEEYGIEVEFNRLVSSDLAQRYGSEAESGNVFADLIASSELGFLRDASANGWLTGLSEAGIPGFEEYPEQWVHSDPDSVTVAIVANGIVYNTERVDADAAPTSYLDLADERFEDEIAIVNPGETASYMKYWSGLIDAYGEDVVAAIAANVRQGFPSAVPMTAAIGAGEASVGMFAPNSSSLTAIMEGAPLEMVPPKIAVDGEEGDVLFGGEVVLGISSDAPNPNAARLFAYYIMTPTEDGPGLVSNDTSGYLGPLVPDHVAALENFVRLPAEVDEERSALILELLDL